MQPRPTILIFVLLLVGSTAVAEETRKSEIDTFDSVQQNSDYRVSLLGVTKGVAFLNSQELVSDGGRTGFRILQRSTHEASTIRFAK